MKNLVGGEVIIGNTAVTKAYTLNKIKRVSEKSFFKDIKSLRRELDKNKQKLVKTISNETGYTMKDSEDLVRDSITFLRGFKKHIKNIKLPNPIHPFNFKRGGRRKLDIVNKPYGIVTIITPRNTPLILDLIGFINALYAGNYVIVKPSSKLPKTTEYLMRSLTKSFSKVLLSNLSILNCNAEILMKTAIKKSDLIHFIGASKFTKEVLIKGIRNNKKIIYDGEGSSIVVIDKIVNLNKAVKICISGLTRCNGQLCTTIRGILIHIDIAHKFINALEKKLRKNKLNPSISLITDYRSKIVHKSKFGPYCWILKYQKDEWKNFIRNIDYSLTDALISNDSQMKRDFIKFSKAPRVAINIDPTEESVFEPWGGYLPYSFNDVDFWLYKYQKKIQVDSF